MQRRQSMTNRVFGLMGIGLFLLTTGQAQAASGNGPYYATPSWDQKLPATTRFVVLTDWNSEAVLDRETGLVWEQSPAITTHDWNTTRYECSNRTIGNRKGWRLPSVHELASLIEPSVAHPGPTLPPGHPFTNVQSNQYWVATRDVANPRDAWVVDFERGIVATNFAPIQDPSQSERFPIWCVRGGNNADAY